MRWINWKNMNSSSGIILDVIVSKWKCKVALQEHFHQTCYQDWISLPVTSRGKVSCQQLKHLHCPRSLQGRILSMISTQMRQTSTKETGNSAKSSSFGYLSSCTCSTTGKINVNSIGERTDLPLRNHEGWSRKKLNRNLSLWLLAGLRNKSACIPSFMKPFGFIGPSVQTSRCCWMPLTQD